MKVGDRLEGRDINRISVSEAMEIQDAMSPEWRALIYDYGQMKVLALLQRGYDLRGARQMLGAKEPHYCKPIRKCRR